MSALASVQGDRRASAAGEDIGQAANAVDGGLRVAGGHEDAHGEPPRDHCIPSHFAAVLAPRGATTAAKWLEASEEQGLLSEAAPAPRCARCPFPAAIGDPAALV